MEPMQHAGIRLSDVKMTLKLKQNEQLCHRRENNLAPLAPGPITFFFFFSFFKKVCLCIGLDMKAASVLTSDTELQ